MSEVTPEQIAAKKQEAEQKAAMRYAQNVTTKKEKVVLTPEQIAAKKQEAEQKAAMRYALALNIFKTAQQLSGAQREAILSGINGKKDFQLTPTEWEQIEAGKELKPAFMKEIKEKYDLVRKLAERAPREKGESTNSYASLAGWGNVADASIDESGNVFNAELANAGKHVRAQVDAIMGSPEWRLLFQNGIRVQTYARVLTQEDVNKWNKANPTLTPITPHPSLAEDSNEAEQS